MWNREAVRPLDALARRPYPHPYHCKKKSRNSNKIFAAKGRKEHRDKNLWSFFLCQGNVCQGNGSGPGLDYSPDNHSPDFSPALPILRWSSPCSFWLRLAALGHPWFNSLWLRMAARRPRVPISLYCGQAGPSLFKAFFLSEKWSHKHLSDSIFLTSPFAPSAPLRGSSWSPPRVSAPSGPIPIPCRLPPLRQQEETEITEFLSPWPLRPPVQFQCLFAARRPVFILHFAFCILHFFQSPLDKK